MDTQLLDNKFARLGARVKLVDRPTRRWPAMSGTITLDIQADRQGEYFQIVQPPSVHAELEVLDVQPTDRHLLLMVREGQAKHKFLCGHDERHWFVAAIPETAAVGTVRQAKEALKPVEVKSAQARQRIGGKARNRRKNAAYVRQGEWFFLPMKQLVVDDKLVIPNEPLSRGNGGKPHWAEFCYRTGGEAVYVCNRHPGGVTEATYRKLVANHRDAKNWNWRTMRRNAGVFVRGRIRHADHKTIVLQGWHQVVMNTENQSRAMRNVAFLD